MKHKPLSLPLLSFRAALPSLPPARRASPGLSAADTSRPAWRSASKRRRRASAARLSLTAMSSLQTSRTRRYSTERPLGSSHVVVSVMLHPLGTKATRPSWVKSTSKHPRLLFYRHTLHWCSVPCHHTPLCFHVLWCNSVTHCSPQASNDVML